MIQIKGIFSGWREVDKSFAKEYIKSLLERIVAIRGIDAKIKYINDNRLKGITVEELLRENK